MRQGGYQLVAANSPSAILLWGTRAWMLELWMCWRAYHQEDQIENEIIRPV